MQLTLRAQCRKTADIRTGKTACKGAGGEACPFLRCGNAVIAVFPWNQSQEMEPGKRVPFIFNKKKAGKR